MAKQQVATAELAVGESAVNVTIVGRAPGLLMHNAQSMLQAPSTKSKICTHGNPLNKPCDGCLEASAYRDADGNLIIPSVALHGAMINASSPYKFEKAGRSAAPLVAGVVRVEPFEVRLLDENSKPIKKFDIHTTPVVIQRQRVIRMRPWIKSWRADFQVVYDRTMLTQPDTLKAILVDAGRRVGILDFRPQHRGSFGTFTVERWEAA